MIQVAAFWRTALAIGVSACWLGIGSSSASAVLIVADQQLMFMQLYDENTLTPNPGTTFSDPSLFLPSSIAIGPDKNIYVAANFSQGVFRFDGQTLAPMGMYAFYPGSSPGTIRFSPSGDLYMVDAANGNIRIFQGPGGALPGQ